MLAGVFQNPQGEFRQRRQQDMFFRHLLFQAFHLLMQGAQKEQQPWLPVWGMRANSCLRLTQSQVIAFLAVLDDAFKRTIRRV